MSPGGQIFGLRVAASSPPSPFRFALGAELPDWPLSHGDLSPDTAAQLWPVRTAFPGSSGGKNCFEFERPRLKGQSRSWIRMRMKMKLK